MKYGMVVSLLTNTIFAPIVYKGNLINNIIKLKNMGYDGIEIGGIRNTKDINLKEIKEVLKKNNMLVMTLGTAQPYFDDGLSFSDDDKNIRKEAVYKVKDIIRLARELEGDVMLSIIFGKVNIEYEDNKTEKINIAKKRILECIVECMDYSSTFNTNFLIEPLNRYETNIFNKLEEVDCFIDNNKNKLDVTRIGILPDTFHMNIEEINITETFEKFKDRIKHIHFSDSNRCSPGSGHTDFLKIIEVLKNNQYKGNISFEILPYPDADSAARSSIDFVKKYF